MSTITDRFDEIMNSLYERTRKATNGGYNATTFRRMVREKGGLQTAKELLNSDDPQFGLGRLWEHNCLELSMEFQVLQPEFAPLFCERDLAEAEKRLAELGYTVDPDGSLKTASP